MVSARTIAALSLMRAIRKPWKTPQIAGGRKSSRQRRETDSMRNRSRQKMQGMNERAALTQRVRRERFPTTKPPVQDQAASRKALHSRRSNPGGSKDLAECRTDESRRR